MYGYDIYDVAPSAAKHSATSATGRRYPSLYWDDGTFGNGRMRRARRVYLRVLLLGRMIKAGWLHEPMVRAEAAGNIGMAGDIGAARRE